MRRIIFSILILCLPAGCYFNWNTLDAFTRQIDCTMSKEQVIALAKQYEAGYQWDDENNVLSILKEQDAIAAQFNRTSARLITVAAMKSVIQFMGLHRKRGPVFVVLRC